MGRTKRFIGAGILLAGFLFKHSRDKTFRRSRIVAIRVGRWPAAALRNSFAAFLFALLTATPALANEPAKQLLALVDYIGGDYKTAVESGRIINQLEYDEMLEFSRSSLEIFEQLKASEKGRDAAGIEKELRALALHIEGKSGEKVVPELARRIKDRLIEKYNIITYPKALPNLAAGKALYLQNCAQCHGETGRGDGPAAKTMQPTEPPPANFHDADLMNGLSPFKAFNTTSFGIQGTGMPSFSALTEEERWQVAYYVLSLRFSPEEAAEGGRIFKAAGLPVELKDTATLATLSDQEISERLKPHSPHAQDSGKILAYLRRGLLEEVSLDPLLIARNYLREAMSLYEKGDKKEAYQKSVDAYLDGFEMAEPALFTKEASFGRRLEAQFTEFRGSVRRGDDIAKIRELYAELDKRLIRAAEILSRETTGGSYTFFNAALIILREGLEAGLIVGAIIAVLKATGTVEAIRYVHFGWVLALLSGILTWGLAQTVLSVSGAQREVMEGLTSVIAALVLFSASYWLISKAEARKWQQYIRGKVEEAVTGRRIMALVGVSFLAAYREAFETVLFYQALWLQSHTAQNQVIWGFLVGVVLLAALVVTLFKLGLKIPLRHFFGASSALLYLLAFVFAGEGIKDLQAAGWFSETPLQNLPQIPWLGIYPTMETTLAQGAMILALIFALIWLGRARWISQTEEKRV